LFYPLRHDKGISGESVSPLCSHRAPVLFGFSDSAEVCFNLTAPAGAQIYLSADKTPMTAPFSLGTLGPCN